MAEQKMTVKFPRQSITYLLLCLTGVLIFIFAGILPNSRTSELNSPKFCGFSSIFMLLEIVCMIESL